ncbi:MAG: LamG domain-containing protein [Pseudomonadota bacterium]
MMTQLITCGLLVLSSTVWGQAYTPDVLELDGRETLVFAGEPEFSFTQGGSVEFWVAPGWVDAPGYDPAILSRVGETGTEYLVALLRERNGLGVLVGDSEHVVSFDFSDGQLHHVALVTADDELAVLIDGRVRGIFAVSPTELDAGLLYVGTSNGIDAAFEGAIAALRFWRIPLTQEEVVSFALRPVLDKDGREHPALDNLVALSDFNNDTVNVIDHVTQDSGDQP